MAVLTMQKVRLLVHREVASEVLRAIQKLGAVEFTPVTQEEVALTQRNKTAFEFNYVHSRLDFAVQFLSRYEAPRGGFARMVEGDKIRTTGTEVHAMATSFHYNDTIDAAQRIEETLVQAHTKIGALESERTLLAPWDALNQSLGEVRETATTRTLFVSGTDAMFTAAAELRTHAGIRSHEERVTDTHRVLVYAKEQGVLLEATLTEAGLEQYILPMRRGTPHEELERITRALATEARTILTAEEEARALAATSLSKLKIVADYIYWQKQKHDLMSGTLMSEQVLVFEGWCPTTKRTILEERIRHKTDHYAIEDCAIGDSEVPPVEIENSSFFRPFESVTRLYGMPGHTDLDPTVFLASFFIVFFGLALTDFGYGLFLTALTAFILLRYRVPTDLARMLQLIMYGGVITMVAGLLFGGYLGIDMTSFPKWVHTVQQFDPIKNPIPVFYLALSLGMLQILTGLALSIRTYAKNNQLREGMLTKGPWIGAFVSGLMVGAQVLGYLPGERAWYLGVLYAMVALIVLIGAYRERNWLLKPFMGILALYDIVGYFSDLLSYSRLLALGLSTSALAFAINLIASMLRDVPYVGFVLMAIVFVAGHLFNLVVNLLGAFVHSARLQFVEFFSKFMGDSGREFRPFKRHERFVLLDEQT